MIKRLTGLAGLGSGAVMLLAGGQAQAADIQPVQPIAGAMPLVHNVGDYYDDDWHSRWRSHHRWGSGDGWHNRWRSHHRWGSHDDWHSRWRSHRRWGSGY